MHKDTDILSQRDKNADTPTITDRQTHTHTLLKIHTQKHTKTLTDEQPDTKTHLLAGLWPTPLVQSLKEAVGRVVSSKEQPVSTQNVALSCQRQNAML